MKILDIIAKLDRTNKAFFTTPSWSDISNSLGLEHFEWSEDTRLKAYYIATHYCTDSYVGLVAYFLDDEFIAISNQVGRKWDEEFQFVSLDAVKRTREYILSLISPNYSTPKIINSEEEYSDGYEVEYSGQLLPQFHRFGIYKPTGETVEIIGAADDYKRFHLVKIKFPDGREQEDDVRNFKFEYCKHYKDSRIVRI